MTWECLVCGAMNPVHNVICGSETCQLRRLAGPQTPAPALPQTPAIGPALAVVAEDRSSEPRTSPRTNHSYPAEFEAFWKEYPSRKDKLAALRAWKRAVAGGASPALLREAASRYRNNPKRDPNFTKYAERWLNAGAWMDEDTVDRPDSHAPQATDWDAVRAEEDARIEAWRAEV